MILKIVDRATDKWKRLTYMTEAIIKKIIAFWSPHMSLFFISYMWVYLCTHSNNNNDDNDKMRHVLCLLKWQKNKNKNPWTVKNIKCESLLSFFLYPFILRNQKKMKITSSHSLHSALSVGDMLDWMKRKKIEFIDVIKFDEEIFFYFLHFNVSAQHGWFLPINNG